MDWLFNIRKGKLYIFGIEMCCNPFFTDYDELDSDYEDDGYQSSVLSGHESDEP